jgi:RimJ/RimL family protein N-acetyltransferase
LEREDVERLHRWKNDPDVTYYLGQFMPVSRHEEEAAFEQGVEARDKVRLAITTREGRHIGVCGLHIISQTSRCAELWIMIGERDCRGQGLGSDALVTLCRFGFDLLNLHRIGLKVYDFNTRGIRCYAKCGFVEEGRMREAAFRQGTYHDVIQMGLLAEEFRSRFPRAERAPE